MPQDVFLFQATIAENTAYGCLEASRAEFEAAAREAGVERLVQRFPHGLETMVGERGATLSVGCLILTNLINALRKRDDSYKDS